MRVRDIADDAYVSSTSVFRFVQKWDSIPFLNFALYQDPFRKKSIMKNIKNSYPLKNASVD